MNGFNIVYILEQLYNGLFYGAMYSLCAVGFSLIWGTMKLLNFAHGTFYMLGAYFTWWILSLFNLPPLLSLLLSVGIVFLIAIGFMSGLISPLIGKHEWEEKALVITLGLSVIFENSVLLIAGAKWRAVPSFVEGQISLIGINFRFQNILILTLSILIMIAFWALLKFTIIGKSLRAAAQNKEAASLYGINVKRIYLLTFGLSCSLIAVAGGFLAPILYIYPTVGGHPFLMSFVIVIIGGLGSFKGSIFSGFLVGILRSICISLVSATWADMIIFVIMIFVLIIKPTGLFGIEEE